MKRLIAAALVAGATLAAFASPSQAATIGIDFGCGVNNINSQDCVSGDAPLQDGYLGWAGTYGGNPGADYDETRSFSADFGVGGSFNLNVTSDALYFRDYAQINQGTYAPQSALLSDSILRNSPGLVTFTFSGLTAGTYSMESFHHDTAWGFDTALFDVIVADALGTNTVVSGADTSGGTSPTSITLLAYLFTVGADGTATVTFNTSGASSGNHMSINGFQLSLISPVPLPAGVWLLLSALGGLGFSGWLRKQAVAS